MESSALHVGGQVCWSHGIAGAVGAASEGKYCCPGVDIAAMSPSGVLDGTDWDGASTIFKGDDTVSAACEDLLRTRNTRPVRIQRQCALSKPRWYVEHVPEMNDGC